MIFYEFFLSLKHLGKSIENFKFEIMKNPLWKIKKLHTRYKVLHTFVWTMNFIWTLL